jgi:predicted aldo/keto reductase-like oxidoreductase
MNNKRGFNMRTKTNSVDSDQSISRRNFVKVGGAMIAGTTLNIPPIRNFVRKSEEEEKKIVQYRTLGRIGFKVSDISMGGTRSREANVVRYAYDRGINYFDTGETYTRGASETAIGEAQQFMDRKKIFITTKLPLREDETEESIIERFRKCLERLQTDYTDALYMHGVTDVASLNHPGYHAAIKRLKSEGRVKYTGISSHGPRRGEGDSMEKVCLAAAEDGRFDLMLFIYNFMNTEAGDKILAACKKNNVGTTAMKTSPGVLKFDPFDPENLTEQQEESIKRMMNRGSTREAAVQRMEERVQSQQENYEKTKPFVEKYGIKTEDQLRLASIQWVLQNPTMHTVCISFSDFDLVDKVVPLSGTKMSEADRRFLEEYKLVYNNQYCRHGCNICVEKCPHQLPVSSIMRYAYYFECQGREKDAIQKYAKLEGLNSSYCMICNAPCLRACPYGVDVQANLLQAHSLLTLV